MLLKTIVEQNHYQFVESYPTWQDAIYGVAKTMLDDGTLDKEYLDDIIKNVNTYGPYFVIMPNVAMPHSTLGGKGVHKNAIGFCKVEVPVKFDELDSSKDARLFFPLAAVDNEKHLENMSALCDMLLKEGLVESLLKAKNKEDLLAIDQMYSD